MRPDARASGRASTPRSPRSSSRTGASVRRTRCPAASSSASPWPGRSRCGPACSCSTSRRPISTPTARPSVRVGPGAGRRPAGCDARSGGASGRRVAAAGRSRGRHRCRRRGCRRWAAGRRLSRARRTARRCRRLGAGLPAGRASAPRPAAPVGARDRRARRLPVSGHARGRRRECRSVGPLVGGAGDHRAERERQVDPRAADRRAARTPDRAGDRWARRSRAGHGHEPIAGWPARDLVGRIGTVFQDPEHQFLTGSVREELLLGPRRAGLSDDGRRPRVPMSCSSDCASTHLAAANPFTLSGGEKRRLSVATALATRAGAPRARRADLRPGSPHLGRARPSPCRAA